MKSESRVVECLVRGRTVGALSLAALVALAVPAASAVECGPGYGDVTGDGLANVVDTQCAILSNLWYLTGQAGPQPPCLVSPDAADLSCDGTTNVVDVTITISIALKQNLSSQIDANGNNCHDACEAPAECGNGTLDAGEECDDGNNLPDDGCSPLCAIESVAPTAGSLIISEIMANPAAASDSDGEWFEVFNPGAAPVQLNGVTISDQGSDSHLIEVDLSVPAGGYAVLGNNGDTAVNGGVTLDYVYTGIFLSNSADELVLTAADLTMIDMVAWDNAWPIFSGSSIHLDPGSTDAAANDLMANWCPASTTFGAGDFGTPGAANPNCGVCGDGVVEGLEQCDDGTANNSDTLPDACRTDCRAASCGDAVQDSGEACDDGNDVMADGCEPDCSISPEGVCGNGILEFGEQCDDGGTVPGDGCDANCNLEAADIQPGDLIVTEIMKDPFAVSDNFGEWVEVFNTTDADINLLGFVLRDADTDTHSITSSVIVPALGFAVLGRSSDMATNGNVVVDYVYADFFLGNGDDEVILEFGGTVIDAVAYTDLAFPDLPGRSLSLDASAFDATANDDGANWCPGLANFGTGEGDYGTPGAANAACPVCGDGAVEGLEECDDAAANSDTTPDACRTDCTMAGCGDGVMDAGEECDDGNLVDGDGCQMDCTETPTGLECGDGIVAGDEQCDDGNLLNGDGCSSNCMLEVPNPLAGEIIITEIMNNPTAVTDNNGEWFEVFNITSMDLSLDGLQIADLGTNLHVISGGLVVPAMGYAVLGINGDTGTNGGVTVDYVYPSNWSLGNSDDEVIIRTIGGEVIDMVAYDGGPLFPDPSDRSMSLDIGSYDATANDDGANWCVGFVPFGAGDFGTPGADNPACPVCGNGVVEGFETCDDAELNSDTAADACRTNCQMADCGDGVTDSGEECDDANFVAGDGCENDCTVTVVAVCGDGVVEGDEECDDAGANSDTEPDACRTNCQLAGCGDSVIDAGEECDDGNDVGGDGCSQVCSDEGATPQVGQLIITEIMQNPLVVADNLGEWFELYNAGTVALDLFGLVITDNNTNTHTIGMSVLVPPGGYAVLGNNGNSLTNGGVAVDYVFPAAQFVLGNSSDTVSLQLGDGTVIDSVSYDNGATFPDPNGASMNLDVNSYDATLNDLGSNWCEATQVYGAGDFGTPGAANTACASAPVCGNGVLEAGEDCDDGNLIDGDGCESNCTVTPVAECGNGAIEGDEECDDGGVEPGDGCDANCNLEGNAPMAGDLVITEVMQDPAAVSDNNGEWFEILNVSAGPINLLGLVLTDNGTNNHTVLLPVIVDAGAYAVLGLNGNIATNGGVTVDYVYANYSLGNSSDAIILTYEGTEIDRIEWDNGATFPDPTGASMNLDPGSTDAVSNNNGANWCVGSVAYGAGDLGTPGEANTPCAAGGAGAATWGDVQPFLSSKCGNCHSFPSSYAQTQVTANNTAACNGLTVGECILIRVQNGSMPQFPMCTGDPILDAGAPACMTQEEQDTLQSWIDGGMLEQ